MYVCRLNIILLEVILAFSVYPKTTAIEAVHVGKWLFLRMIDGMISLEMLKCKQINYKTFTRINFLISFLLKNRILLFNPLTM